MNTITSEAAYKPAKGDVVALFDERSSDGRPYLRMKAVVVGRAHATCLRVRRTHITHTEGVSWIDDSQRTRRPFECGAHLVDLFPGGDDVAIRNEYKRRVAEWERANPELAAADKAEQARQARVNQEVTRALSKLMRNFL
jgi:hypothetical protein